MVKAQENRVEKKKWEEEAYSAETSYLATRTRRNKAWKALSCVKDDIAMAFWERGKETMEY